MIIKSPVPAIDNLKVSTMKSGRPIDGKFVVVGSQYPIVVSVSKKGTIFTNDDARSFNLESFWWVKHVLSALVTLKVISKDDMDTHMAAVAEKKRKDMMALDKDSVKEVCKKHGWTVKFPPEKKNK